MSNVYELRQTVKQSEFVCSACGSARDCNCNAPALERLAELEKKKETQRQQQRDAMRRAREKTKENQGPVNSQDAAEEEASAQDARSLIYRGLVEGLALALSAPWGKCLSNAFLREVFEEFLSKRRGANSND